MKSNLEYNKTLRTYARYLRKNMTKSVACLWKYALKGHQMLGYQFRRQRPVLNYIADFMCKELKLIIEVDGLTHQWEETQEKDKKKDTELKEAGFMVLRFQDEEVLHDLENVIRSIENEIKRIKSA